ncbi:MAG: tetratricopeptide repeat protein [Acidobacteriia bacterium]|nr:tetratricopeptide repeat protein [Terriglobia bacterium]
MTIPDFESWFRLRLHLTEALPARSPAEALTLPEAPSLSTAEASRLADQLAERIKNAERNGIPAERIWSQLGRPLLQVLEQGGLAEQQQYWLTRFAGYRALLNEHVQSLEREEGETSIETLLAMVDLAKLAQEQGDLTEAVRLWSSILERFRRKPGENDDNILLAMGGLAIALAEQGNLTSAGKLQAEILRLEEGRFGVDHPDLLRPLNNLGITLRHHGDYAGARRVLERALGIAQRSLREGDPSRLQLMMNLANTLTEQGDFAAAERLLQQVVERYSRELGPNHSNTLKAKLNLAVALKHQKHQGEWEAAKRLEQTVVECSRRLMGEKHPFAARAASNLLLTLLGQGAFSEAKALFHSSLEWVIAADPSSWSADLIQLRSQLQDLLPQLQEAPAETPQSRSE